MDFLEKRELASHYLFKQKERIRYESQIFNISNNNTREFSRGR